MWNEKKYTVSIWLLATISIFHTYCEIVELPDSSVKCEGGENRVDISPILWLFYQNRQEYHMMMMFLFEEITAVIVDYLCTHRNYQ